MEKIIGVLLIIGGIVLGLYVGVWVCFVGGIVQIIEQIRADNLIALQVGIGIAKMVFAGVAGWLSAIMLILPGVALIDY